MNKNVSIVCVDSRPYRKIAQENWGLTDEQMKGKHVHHRVAESEGGTNDPSNLYVCSPSFHRWGWHEGEEWIEWAERGVQKAHEGKNDFGKSILGVENGKRLHETKNEEGKSLNASKGGRKGGKKTHARKNEDGKSIHALETSMKAHSEKTPEGKSVLGVKNAERMHSAKDHEGKSVNAVKGGKKGAEKTNAQIWESTIDGFRSNAGAVARHNKANGWDPKSKVKLEQEGANQ
jgi:hypothetical protein